MLRFLTAGESHGPKLTAILDGLPANVPINQNFINNELKLRQLGYGRSARQKIEQDIINITGGIRFGLTTGGPICLEIENKDYQNWQDIMQIDNLTPANKLSIANDKRQNLASFRPGHADLAGTIKFKHSDIRNVLERASARETAMRVAIGAVCLQFLNNLNINLTSHVKSIGTIKSNLDSSSYALAEINQIIKTSQFQCLDLNCEIQMLDIIKQAQKQGNSLGGVIEILADNLPIGLGSYTQWDRRIDGLLAQSIMSIQAIKAVEIGEGINNAYLSGSKVQDAIVLDPHNAFSPIPFKTLSNKAGGIEGGMTNGQRLVIHAFMKPIPTIAQSLPTISFPDFKETTSFYERSDVCAVSSCAIICKAMVAFSLSERLLDKFAGDNFNDIKEALESHFKYIQNLVN